MYSMHFIFLLLSLSLCSASNSSYLEDWERFKVNFKKRYNSTEIENKRMQIFFENMKIIEKHNIRFKEGLESFEMGMNQYGDQTQKEFERALLGIGKSDDDDHEDSFEDNSIDATAPENKRSWLENVGSRLRSSLASVSSVWDFFKRLPGNVVNLVELLAAQESSTALNETVDWAKLGAVTPAKDQGYCGSCWAFSALGALEGHLFRKNGKLVPLSVQNLIDCTQESPYNNEGCGGGHMTVSYRYIIDNNGVASERDYPYEEKDSTCRYEDKLAAGTCRNIQEIFGEKTMKYALSQIGPLSVVMDASTIEFRFYKSGVYESNICGDDTTNHAVVLTGYGTSNGKEYWTIKNSWGTTWGENGFAKISRARSCGINGYALYPIV